jgi:hypothetical protein
MGLFFTASISSRPISDWSTGRGEARGFRVGLLFAKSFPPLSSASSLSIPSHTYLFYFPFPIPLRFSHFLPLYLLPFQTPVPPLALLPSLPFAFPPLFLSPPRIGGEDGHTGGEPSLCPSSPPIAISPSLPNPFPSLFDGDPRVLPLEKI